MAIQLHTNDIIWSDQIVMRYLAARETNDWDRRSKCAHHRNFLNTTHEPGGNEAVVTSVVQPLYSNGLDKKKISLYVFVRWNESSGRPKIRLVGLVPGWT